ncbi:lanthionine synthetase LanC family protein [Rudanella lutea]|uniref:lanthionine synthetase LanC family protein n=1 Tax=Rudanella lutea TaxID=451374 RepID=UPI0003648C98|nr:lanthionine synthetase LanC family protein [Rudanella lutea]
MKPINKTPITDQIERIANELPQYQSWLQTSSYDQGLFGLSLFYCFYARYTGDDSHYITAEEHFDKALEMVGPGHYVKRFRQDFIGNDIMMLGRYIEYSKRHGFLDIDTNEFLKQADDVVADTVRRRTRFGDLDLFGGAMMGAHYFHARLASTGSAREMLAELVDEVDRLAQYDEVGGAFWKAPTLQNRVYFGLSHGSAMILSFLARMHELGIRPETCRRLLRSGVQFVLAHRRTQPLGLFPIMLNDEVEPKQFSQCYGDLGTGYGLFRASQILTDDADLQQQTRDVLVDCCNRTVADGCTFDASITYGAAGLAGVFDKLYRLSNDPMLAAAANNWYASIMKYAKPTGPFGGFDSFFDEDKNSYMRVSWGWGMIGIGIALMQYQDNTLPPFDGLNMTI